MLYRYVLAVVATCCLGSKSGDIIGVELGGLVW